MTHKVLVIEDQPEMANLVKLHLNDIDCRVKLASDGLSGIAEAEANHYDLIVLDLMLPGEDGLEICRRLRARADYTPILMLTSRSTELDRVLGLEMGADDYVTKPFSVLEFVARVKAIFRRIKAISAGSTMTTTIFRAGDMLIDAARRSVTVEGRSVDLTAKEFELLLHLAQNAGRVYSREQLLDFVWGYNHSGYQHTVNSHINRLRNKIERDPANPVYVRTVWGVGYKFSEGLISSQPPAAK
jgi:two-component system OmpR family response regulator